MLKYYKPRTEVFINKIRPFLIKLYKDEISEIIPDTPSIKADWDNILNKVNPFVKTLFLKK